MLVKPVATPVTIPDVASTVATVVLDDVQVPPVTKLLSVRVLPAHTVMVPFIVPAVVVAFTVTILVAVSVPQLLVTV